MMALDSTGPGVLCFSRGASRAPAKGWRAMIVYSTDYVHRDPGGWPMFATAILSLQVPIPGPEMYATVADCRCLAYGHGHDNIAQARAKTVLGSGWVDPMQVYRMRVEALQHTLMVLLRARASWAMGIAEDALGDALGVSPVIMPSPRAMAAEAHRQGASWVACSWVLEQGADVVANTLATMGA